ncbi:hypothetical protein RIR_jg26945.t1 [Rhizophagus irregularis DAOM 181602=DAOM 197198]|nr:hypothetical protein RIR_jg26945.t1 [Rhizophagus irregularis DAOM 181602=DAOM 197198]
MTFILDIRNPRDINREIFVPIGKTGITRFGIELAYMTDQENKCVPWGVKSCERACVKYNTTLGTERDNLALCLTKARTEEYYKDIPLVGHSVSQSEEKRKDEDIGIGVTVMLGVELSDEVIEVNKLKAIGDKS